MRIGFCPPKTHPHTSGVEGPESDPVGTHTNWEVSRGHPSPYGAGGVKEVRRLPDTGVSWDGSKEGKGQVEGWGLDTGVPHEGLISDVCVGVGSPTQTR